MEFLALTHWYQWLGVLLALACGAGGVYWSLSAPEGLTDGEVTVTTSGRVIGIVLSTIMSLAVAGCILFLGR